MPRQPLQLPSSLPLLLCMMLGVVVSCGDPPAVREDPAELHQQAVRDQSDRIREKVFRDARSAVTDALALATRTEVRDDPVLMSLAERTLAHVYRIAGRMDSARMYIDRALARTSPASDRSGYVDALIIRSILYSQASAWDSTLVALDEAARYVDPAKDSLSQALIHLNRANALSARGDYTASARLYLLAARLFTALGEDRYLALAYGNLGVDNNDLGDDTSAVRYIERAIEINSRLGSLGDLARDYANLGIAYRSLNELGKAIKSHATSLDLARKLGNNELIAQNLMNLGNVYGVMGRDHEAETSYLRSLEICRAQHVPYGILVNSLALGELYSRQGRRAEAFPYLKGSLEAARQMRLAKETVRAHEMLSSAFADMGNYPRAYTHLRRYVDLLDSLLTPDQREEFSRLQVEYETEKKDHENKMLRSENRIAQLTVDRQRTFAISVTVILVLITVVLIVVYLSRRMKIRSLTLVEEKNLIIERKSSQLEESNTLKELLLDIITHDLINPVSTITGAADLLRENPGDERIIDIIDKSSRHVSEVAQNAAALSRVVIDGEIPKEPLSLHDLVETVREEFRTAFERKGMAFENRIPAGLQIDANPVLIEVYRNFASNALRYASEGGKVIVRSDEALDAVTVCFVDFGQTIPEQMRERIFLRRVQVEPGRRRGSGLGLAIVERIVRAHGGTAWVEPNSPKGNVFCVKLPRDHA